MARRKKDDIAGAIARLQNEELFPVRTLADEVGVCFRTMERWIFAGKTGIWLDGLKRQDVWMSSREAVQRFLEVIEGRRLSELPPELKLVDVNELIAIATLAANGQASGRWVAGKVMGLVFTQSEKGSAA